MTTYRIINTQSGLDMGCVEANDEREALDIMAREAGYRDHDHACEQTDCEGMEAREVEPYPKKIYLHTTKDNFYKCVSLTPSNRSWPIFWAQFRDLDGDLVRGGGAVLVEDRGVKGIQPAACEDRGVDELIVDAVKLYAWPSTEFEAEAQIHAMKLAGWLPDELRTFVAEWGFDPEAVGIS